MSNAAEPLELSQKVSVWNQNQLYTKFKHVFSFLALPLSISPLYKGVREKHQGVPPPLAGAYVLHPVTMITGYGELGPGGIATTRGCAQGVVRSRVSVVCHS